MDSLQPSSDQPTSPNSQPRRRPLVSRSTIKLNQPGQNLNHLTQHFVDFKESQQKASNVTPESTPSHVNGANDEFSSNLQLNSSSTSPQITPSSTDLKSTLKQPEDINNIGKNTNHSQGNEQFGHDSEIHHHPKSSLDQPSITPIISPEITPAQIPNPHSHSSSAQLDDDLEEANTNSSSTQPQNSSFIRRIFHRSSDAPKPTYLNQPEPQPDPSTPKNSPSQMPEPRLTVNTSQSSRKSVSGKAPHHVTPAATSSRRFSQDDTTFTPSGSDSFAQNSSGGTLSRIFSGFRSKDTPYAQSNTPHVSKNVKMSNVAQHPSSKKKDANCASKNLQNLVTDPDVITDDEFVVIKLPLATTPQQTNQTLPRYPSNKPQSAAEMHTTSPNLHHTQYQRENGENATSFSLNQPPTLSHQSSATFDRISSIDNDISRTSSFQQPVLFKTNSTISPLSRQLDLNLIDQDNNTNNLSTTVPLELTPRRAHSLDTNQRYLSPSRHTLNVDHEPCVPDTCLVSPTSAVSISSSRYGQPTNPPSPTSSTSSLRARRAIVMRSRFNINTPTSLPNPDPVPSLNTDTPEGLNTDLVSPLLTSRSNPTVSTPSTTSLSASASPQQVNSIDSDLIILGTSGNNDRFDSTRFAIDTTPILEVDEESSSANPTVQPNLAPKLPLHSPSLMTIPPPDEGNTPTLLLPQLSETLSQSLHAKSSFELLRQQMELKQRFLETMTPIQNDPSYPNNTSNRTEDGAFLPDDLESTRNITITDVRNASRQHYTFDLNSNDNSDVFEDDDDACLVRSPEGSCRGTRGNSKNALLGLPGSDDEEYDTESSLPVEEQEFLEKIHTNLKSALPNTISQTRQQESHCDVQILLTQGNRRENDEDDKDDFEEDVAFRSDETVNFYIFYDQDSDLEDNGNRSDNNQIASIDNVTNQNLPLNDLSLNSVQDDKAGDDDDDDDDDEQSTPRYPLLFTVSHYTPLIKTDDAQKLLTKPQPKISSLKPSQNDKKGKKIKKKLMFSSTISSQLVVPCNLLSFPRLDSQQPLPYPGYVSASNPSQTPQRRSSVSSLHNNDHNHAHLLSPPPTESQQQTAHHISDSSALVQAVRAKNPVFNQ